MTLSASARRQSRSVARLAAIQALYQMEAGGAGVETVVQEFSDHRFGADIEGEPMAQADEAFFADIVRGVVEGQAAIDQAIARRLATGWRLDRIDATLRAILRAGAFELIQRPDVPTEVAIDEYLEITKSFFDGPEPGFVNAALDGIARDRRPPADGRDRSQSGVDEFDLIARLLRPLTDGAPEALNLLDDAAILPARPGFDLVISADAIVEGVHFLPDDPMDQVAQKLLRVNLSDLAAKGAEPYAYFLTISWPARCGWAEREAFAAGLRRDQDAFGLKLLGGDTTSTPGPLTAAATILGWVPTGKAVLRSGARAGDLLLVSGQIGDGWLGLKAALGEVPALSQDARDRYRIPQPRTALAEALRDFAHAAADVSDGLVADAGHIALASGLAVELKLDRVPLSPDGHSHVEGAADRLTALLNLATGGDDYELLIAIPPDRAERLMAAAAAQNIPLTAIGRLAEGEGVTVTYQGRPVSVARPGYKHR